MAQQLSAVFDDLVQVQRQGQAASPDPREADLLDELLALYDDPLGDDEADVYETPPAASPQPSHQGRK